MTWRHVAAALLLAIVVPVFLVAGLAALLVLPVMLTLVALDRIRQLGGVLPRPVPARHTLRHTR